MTGTPRPRRPGLAITAQLQPTTTPAAAAAKERAMREALDAAARVRADRRRARASQRPTAMASSSGSARPPATSVRRGDDQSVVATSDAVYEAGRLRVALGTVRGTGPDGAVTGADVRTAAGVPDPQAAVTAPLPAFTASGMDPQSLLRLPAPVRAAVAAATTLEQAHRLAHTYAGMSDVAAREALAADGTVPLRLGGCQWT